MSIIGLEILPDVTGRPVPVWRQVLRDLSNCAFQTNEVTGLIFVLAVGLYSWLMAIYYVVSVIIGAAVARLAKGVPGLYSDLMGVFLDIGLLGFNAALMGARHLLRGLPARAGALHPGDLLLHGLDSVSAQIIAGVLFLVGVLVANWRLAVVAALSGSMAVSLAQHVPVVGGAVNTGFVGFNAVLAGLAVYGLVAADLRLALLGAFLAAWLFSFVTRNAPFPALASGFVIAVWAILLLDWINPRLAGQPATSEAESTAAN